MPYQKTTWVDGGPPPLSAENLNHLEGQYDAVKEELQKSDGTGDIKPQAVNVLIQDAGGNFSSANVEDALQELAGYVQTGKNTIASAITDMGQQASGSETFSQLASKIRAISTDATAAVGDVLTGKTFYQGGAKKTGTMPNRGAVVLTPGASNVPIPAGYHNGSGYVVGEPDLIPANIRKGTDIFGVTGTLPAVPWMLDFSAYACYANWNCTASSIPPGGESKLLDVSGEGVLSYLFASAGSGRIVIDGTSYAVGGPVAVCFPIYFRQSLKFYVSNPGGYYISPRWGYTYMLKSGSFDESRQTILASSSRVTAGSCTVSGSGYLLAVAAGRNLNSSAFVEVKINGAVLGHFMQNVWVALGPVPFTTSLQVTVSSGAAAITLYTLA